MAVAVLGELKVPPLAVHPARDVAHAAPGVEPLAETGKGRMLRRRAQTDEPQGRTEELTAFVEHAATLRRSWITRQRAGVTSVSLSRGSIDSDSSHLECLRLILTMRRVPRYRRRVSDSVYELGGGSPCTDRAVRVRQRYDRVRKAVRTTLGLS